MSAECSFCERPNIHFQQINNENSVKIKLLLVYSLDANILW